MATSIEAESPADVYLVPVGTFPSETAEQLARHYRQALDLSVAVLPTVPVPDNACDAERDQLVAESMIPVLKASFPALANDPDAVFIGLTTEDMYIAAYDWRFALSYRQDGHFAIVSNARMGIDASSPDLTTSRLRKMVTKNIGVMHYHYPLSGDPACVMYDSIMGLEELDFIADDFRHCDLR